MTDSSTSGRTIAERVGHRWPGMLPRATRSLLRLPPGSRLRRAAWRRVAQTVFEAWNRGDFELVPFIDDPNVETHITLGTAPPIGLDSIYYGPEGHCRSMEVWNEAWNTWDAKIQDVVEEGRDRILVVARVLAVGSVSGIEVNEWGAVRYTFRDGRIVRVDGALGPDRERALAALPNLADGALSQHSADEFQRQ